MKRNRHMRGVWLAGFFVLYGLPVLAQDVSESAGVEHPDSVVYLDEVQVSGKREIRKGDHVELYLSKQNENFGSNAVDAISSLNRFKTTLYSEGLVSYDGQEVFILINGVPADGNILKSYQGEDIKCVEYYNYAPTQYAAYTTGPLANIIVRKRHDRLYSLNVNTSNNVTHVQGINGLNMSYTDSLNRVTVFYHTLYHNVRGMQKHREYNYGDEVSSVYDTDHGRYSDNGQYVAATYQRFQGNHLFNAMVDYHWSKTHSFNPLDISLADQSSVVKGTSGQDMRLRENKVSADLFYKYTFGTRMLMVDVVNSFNKARSTNDLWQQYDPLFSADDYSIFNKLNNKVYSLIATGAYGQSWDTRFFSIMGQYRYLHLDQNTADMSGVMTDGHSVTEIHNAVLEAGFSWRWGDWHLRPSVGARMIKDNTEVKDETTVMPQASLLTMWLPSGKLSGLQSTLSLSWQTEAPSSGELTEAKTYLDRSLDRYYISTGNPYIKPVGKFFGRLNVDYFFPNGRDKINLYDVASYYADNWTNMLSYDPADPDIVYRRKENQGSYFFNAIMLSGSWFPWKWLEIGPCIEYGYTAFDTRFKKIRNHQVRVIGHFAVLLDDWSISGAANMPYKSYSGDFVTRGSAQFHLEVMWKYRDWTFGLDWHYSGDDNYVMGGIPGFNYIDRSTTPAYKRSVSLNITYSFRKGRARQHAYKDLNVVNRDDGVTIRPEK